MTKMKLQDKTVLEFDLSEGMFHVIEPSLLPIRIRDGITDINPNNMDYKSFVKNYEALTNFFRGRSLNIKRRHAKKILNALHISQSNDNDTVMKIMIVCKALSVTDDYWITNDDSERWDKVNVRTNPLHETLSQIALTGSSPLTVTGEVHTPELTGQGAYAKAWMREDDGLYLYKASTANGNESAIEAEVSNILDYTNVPHVHYELMFLNNLEVCRCKNMCNDSFSIVPAGDISSWCSRAGIKFDDYVVGTDPENFYKTVVVDYLVSNSDRHINNWGFYMNNKNGNIESMHPLFDHNNAFDPGDMASKDGGESMMMPGLSKKEAAELAIKSCHFKINEPIPLSVFIDRSHEDSFMERASSLGLLPQSRGSDNVFAAGKTDKGR